MLADDALRVVQRARRPDPRERRPLPQMVLSRGNTEDLATMYRDWRGHDPNVEAMQHDRGLAGGDEGKTP